MIILGNIVYNSLLGKLFKANFGVSIMNEPQIAEQIEFESLDAFINGRNNFHFHFLDCWLSNTCYRIRPHFKRFQEQYPEIEESVTRLTGEADKENSVLPHEQLWEAYKLMSKLVFLEDPYVMLKDNPDNEVLCR